VPHSPSTTTSHAPGSVAAPAIDEAIPAVADSPVAPSPEAARLAVEIERLWVKHVAAQVTFDKNNEEHTKARGSYRKSRAELKEVRDKLSKLLHELKPLISCPGRGGGWSSFLEKRDIPRSTGDSLVRAYKKTLNSEEKSCTTEQLPEQPEMAIRGYLLRQWPMLSRLLKTREHVKVYVSALEEKAEKSFTANGEWLTSPRDELSVDPAS
jgi:hypothetical protein